MSDEYLICSQCCDDLDKIYVFRIKCLIAKTALIDYMVQVKSVNNTNIENFLRALNIKTEDAVTNAVIPTDDDTDPAATGETASDLKDENEQDCHVSVIIEEKIKTEDIKSEIEDEIMSGLSSGDDYHDGKNDLLVEIQGIDA